MIISQVLLLNRLGDRLVVYCANSHISIYQLFLDPEVPGSAPSLAKIQDVDASALSVHPACVVSIMLTHLRTETGRQRSGDQQAGQSGGPGSPSDDSASLIMNVSGRLVLIQVMTVMMILMMITMFPRETQWPGITPTTLTGPSTARPPCWPAAASRCGSRRRLTRPNLISLWRCGELKSKTRPAFNNVKPKDWYFVPD